MKKVIGVLLVLCFALSMNAYAQSGAGTFEYPWSETVMACDGSELIELEGTWKIVDRLIFDENGSIERWVSNWNIKAKGVGSLGNDYNLNYNDNWVINNTSGGTYVETFPITYNLIGKGKAPNYKLKSLIHLTVNSNGDITSDISKTEVTCN